MRVLLDEDVPRPFKRDLVGHEVETVPEMGWAGTKNGVLLRRAAAPGFEVFLTCDRNMQHQQNLAVLTLALVVLAVPNNKMETIRALAPDVLALLETGLGAGTVSVLSVSSP